MRHGTSTELGVLGENWEGSSEDESRHYPSIRAALECGSFRRILLRQLPRTEIDRDDLFQEIAERGLRAESRGKYRPAESPPVAFLIGIGRNIQREARRRSLGPPRMGTIGWVRSGGDEPSATSECECIELASCLFDSLTPEEVALVRRRFGFDGAGKECKPLSGSERSRLHRVLQLLRRRAEALTPVLEIRTSTRS